MYRLTLIILLTSFFISCDNKTPVDPDINGSKGQLSFSIDMTQAPDDVVSLQGILSRVDHDTVFFDFEMTEDKAIAEVEELISGTWILRVNALDEDGHIIYSGSTDVTVVSGETTTVYLNLEPTTGNLKIIVTWGERGLKENIILMAQNSENEWRVISLNTDGSKFTDITSGAYPFWYKDKSQFIYRVNTTTFALYDLHSDEVKILGNTSNVSNFYRYSRYHDKIIYDYKVSNWNWNIGHMNIDGSQSTTVVSDSAWDKMPFPRPGTDWIYYQSNLSGTLQIYKVKFDGTQNEQVTYGSGESSFPAFNKEGNKLIYSNKNEQEESYLIIVEDFVTGEKKQFDFSEVGEALYPTFSEDGKYIIYILVDGPEYKDRSMYVMNTDGTDKVKIPIDPAYHYFARPVTW